MAQCATVAGLALAERNSLISVPDLARNPLAALAVK